MVQAAKGGMSPKREARRLPLGFGRLPLPQIADVADCLWRQVVTRVLVGGRFNRKSLPSDSSKGNTQDEEGYRRHAVETPRSHQTNQERREVARVFSGTNIDSEVPCEASVRRMYAIGSFRQDRNRQSVPHFRDSAFWKNHPESWPRLLADARIGDVHTSAAVGHSPRAGYGKRP